jgi:hypothetical protein
MADRHDESWPDKQMRFAKPYFVIDELRRLNHDENRVCVGLELRALMGVQRILDGKVVQGELFLDLAQ